MKMKLLFLLMFAAAFSTAMSAQDMEQTALPYLTVDYRDEVWKSESQENYAEFTHSTYKWIASIENMDDNDATIYFRYTKDGYETSEWREYDGLPIGCTLGNTLIEVFAVAVGKLPSDVVCETIYSHDTFIYWACLVDGIHYSVRDMDVYVCSRGDSQLGSEPYSGDIVIPSNFSFGYPDNYYTVTGIYPSAFAPVLNEISDITSVELPSTINRVGYDAFKDCANLKRIILHAVTPPDAYELFGFSYYPDDGNISYLYNQVSLFVPNESIEEYRAHEEWSRFTHIVPFIGAGPGDVNGDGSIGIKDATDLVDQLLSDGEVPAWMDVNGDGNVGIKDITDLIDRLLSED